MDQAQAWECGGRPAERGDSGELEALEAYRAPSRVSLAPSVTGGPGVRESLEPARGVGTRPHRSCFPVWGPLGGSRSKASLERDGVGIFLS